MLEGTVALTLLKLPLNFPNFNKLEEDMRLRGFVKAVLTWL